MLVRIKTLEELRNTEEATFNNVTKRWECDVCANILHPEDYGKEMNVVYDPESSGMVNDQGRIVERWMCSEWGIEPKESVNHPNHYNTGKYEVIDVIEDWDLNFNLGNAIKYIARCNHKGNKEEDLKKAIFYINREIGRGE